MPAAIHYHSEGYDTSQSKLMGRHAAGVGFLRACARHARGTVLHCYASNQAQFEDFKRRVAAYDATREARWIPHVALDALAQAGALHFPGPELGALAWQRRHVDPRAYSLTGVTHTIATHRGMDAIGDLLLAPVEPWDALICTSRTVRAAAEQVLADWGEYLAARFGAAPKLDAQLPVIPLGVDCQPLGVPREAEQDRAALRGRYGIGHDDVVFLFLGRLSYHAKANPLPMYLALERAARETGRHLDLILAGWYANEEIQKSFLDAASALCPSVRLVHVDGREPAVRRQIWYAADVFTSLVDNIQETFGLTPIEAMVYGLPVVVSDWNGYRETVRHAVDGFLIPTVMASPGTATDGAGGTRRCGCGRKSRVRHQGPGQGDPQGDFLRAGAGRVAGIDRPERFGQVHAGAPGRRYLEAGGRRGASGRRRRGSMAARPDSSAILPQDVELFAGTVAANISRLGDVDAEAVVDAAHRANAHEMLLRLPHGYDTEIGENGMVLSGGQRQRIALARALYGKPRLVVLDEPNANLDGEGEDALMKTMLCLKQEGATLLVVTHRPSLLAEIDKVLVLREGAAEMFGPRAEIIARVARGSVPAGAAVAGSVVPRTDHSVSRT